MRSLRKGFLKLSFMALALVLNVGLACAVGFAPVVGVAGGFASMLFKTNGLLPMAVQVEIWEADIVGNLFADNSFLAKAYNADQYVLNGKVVHIPVAGGKRTTRKNRTETPATAVKRSDTDINYSLDEFTTDPVVIPDADTAELSYDKRNSVIGEDRESLNETVANEFVYKWSPTTAAQILRTTGDAVAAHLPSATGNRKKLTRADVRKVGAAMNKANIAKNDRYALLDSDMYEQLLESLTEAQQNAFLATANVATGVIGSMFGFTFYERSKAAVYTNDATPVPKYMDAAGAATDNAGAIFWQQNCVERALGEVKMFDDEGNPLYYGDVYSFLVRAGGRIRRVAGVFAVVQAATA